MPKPRNKPRPIPRREAANRLRAKNWSRDVILPIGAFSVGGKPVSMVFSPGGNLILIQANSRCFIWDCQQEKLLSWGDGKLICSAACWSPDGSSLALALANGDVQIRSVPDGTVGRELNRPLSEALAFSPNGRYLAIAGLDVKLWDLQTDSSTRVIVDHPLAVSAFAFNSKGDRLVTACLDNKARVFALSDSSPPDSPRLPLFIVPHAPATPSPPVFVDGDRGLITIGGSQSVQWWNVETGAFTGFKSVESKPKVLHRVVASPAQDWFAVGGEDCVQLWSSADGGKTSLVLDHLNSVQDLAFGKDATTLLTACRDHTARLWSLPEGKPIGDPLMHMGDVVSCAMSVDNKYMATARSDGQIRIWKQPAPYPTATEPLSWGRARLSPDGLLISPGCWHETPFVVSSNHALHPVFNRLVVLNTTTGQPAGPQLPLPGKVSDSCICADNKTLAAISTDLWFWDVPTGRLLFGPTKLPAPPLSVAAHPHLPQTAVLCQNDHILIYDTRSNTLIHNLVHVGGKGGGSGGTQRVSRVEYTPDGSSLVSLSCDGTAIHIWDAETGELRFPPIRPAQAGNFCRSFAISADSKMLATAVTGKNAAQVWDLTTGRTLSKPIPHPGDLFGIFKICFSPDGRYLLTGCKDGQARLWDWKTATLAFPPLQHQDEVYSVAFTADGRYALIGCRGRSGDSYLGLEIGKRSCPANPS